MKIREKLGLGTVQFGLPYGISNKNGQTSIGEVGKILHAAKARNINVLDTASAYGSSEMVLGNSDLSTFKTISKFMPVAGCKILPQLENSLNNLGLNSLYGYLAHRPMDILENPEQWYELQQLKNDGKVKKIGFSLNEPSELQQLLEGNYVPDIVQVPFNYFDRRFEASLIKLKAEGCEIHTRSAFLQGLFFADVDTLDEYFNEIKPIISKLQNLDSLNGALLKFVLGKTYVDYVIIGVETVAQLVNNIQSIESESAMPELEREISNDILIPSRWPKN